MRGIFKIKLYLIYQTNHALVFDYILIFKNPHNIRIMNQEKLQNIEIYGEKYVGIGNTLQPEAKQRLSTLQEPVVQTIKRDLFKILDKVAYVFQSEKQDGKLQKIRKDWDLWGPLLISLTIASTVTLSTSSKQSQQLFTNLFVILWIGPLVISVNSMLLGANIALIQSICLIIYCTSPIMVLSIVILLVNFLIHSFLINIVLSAVALYFTLRGCKQYFRLLVPQDKSYLILYPVMLFYLFLGTYISMA